MSDLSLEELREAAAAATAALAEAEAQAAIPVLSVKDAATQLVQAEANLATVEAPYWELEHATIALNQIRNSIATETDPDIREVHERKLPDAGQRLTAAQGAAQPTAREMDVAAQAVLDARAAVAKAEEQAHEG